MSATVLLKRPQGRMTIEEFLRWDSCDGLKWQLVDGEPQPVAVSPLLHGLIQVELTVLTGNHLRTHCPGYSIITNPGIVPGIMPRWNVRIPDLAVTCSSYVEEEATLNGAVLVVEILSPASQRKAWSNVWTYLTIQGVTEILVIRSDAIGAHVPRRSPDLSWPEEFLEITAGDLLLDSIGFRVPLADLYRTTRLAAP